MAFDKNRTMHQPKEKWLTRWVNRRPVNKEYLQCGKASTLAKCPKCDIRHETYIKWTGRGVPRIYCTTCRSLVAAMGDAVGMGSAPEFAKSARKGISNNSE